MSCIGSVLVPVTFLAGPVVEACCISLSGRGRLTRRRCVCLAGCRRSASFVGMLSLSNLILFQLL